VDTCGYENYICQFRWTTGGTSSLEAIVNITFKRLATLLISTLLVFPVASASQTFHSFVMADDAGGSGAADCIPIQAGGMFSRQLARYRANTGT
jgi:hypothetical protein